MCKALTAKGVSFKTDETALQIYAKFQGDDLPINLQITVNEEYTTIDFACKLAFKTAPPTYDDVLSRLNTINSTLRFGAFILNPENDSLSYRYDYIYAQASPSTELILSLITMVVTVVDAYDGQLKKLVPVNTDTYDPMFG
ncbi:MAG: YbjN domain-containing protein [Methanomethylophilus sp.]